MFPHRKRGALVEAGEVPPYSLVLQVVHNLYRYIIIIFQKH
jgi:hypothetical protein